MKKKIHEISAYFKIYKLRNDKRVVVFLICLLIATTLWFLNALSKDYSTSIYYPVKYVNAPKNQFLANTPPKKLELKVQAHGFTLLRHKLNLSFSPIVLNLTNITQGLVPGADGYNVRTSSLLQRISDQVSNEITINTIQPEFLLLQLDSLKTKTIPVKPDVELDFESQFNLKKPVLLSPNEVEITGPAGILDTILFLQTKQHSFTKLDADVEKNMDILHPENVAVKPEKALLKIFVEKFTEKEINVPVKVVNLPDSTKIKLFPSEVKVIFLVGLSNFGEISSTDFEMVVDFNKIESSVEKLTVEISSKPDFVKSVKVVPGSVEYLIEAN
jgi:hypothetical protein